MNDAELRAALAKLRFQVEQLGDAVDHKTNPIASLVVGMDWDRDDLEAVHDIFEEVSGLLERGENADFGAFERSLKQRFGISYQGIKPIVLAFYRNHQWTDVCEWYVKEHGQSAPAEFRGITETIRKREEGRDD